MGTLKAVLQHPDDFYPLMKLMMATKQAEKQIPTEPHWGFCYSMLHKVSRSFGLVIQQLGSELRDAVSYAISRLSFCFFLLFLFHFHVLISIFRQNCWLLNANV